MHTGTFDFEDASGNVPFQVKMTTEMLEVRMGGRYAEFPRESIQGIGFAGQNVQRNRNHPPENLGSGTLIITYLEGAKKKAVFISFTTYNPQAREFAMALVEDHQEKYIGRGRKREIMDELGLSYIRKVIFPMLLTFVAIALLILAWFLFGPKIADSLLS